jgi:Lon protease-like protein
LVIPLQREDESMEIPLFPLHTVLCPGIVVPLHIFEERYRAMTRHCLETGAPFGIVLIRDGRAAGTSGGTLALAGVGALVEIREADRFPDGRYQLLAAATGRFAIDSVDLSRAPYLVADVTPLDDEVGDEVRAERLAASAIRRFVRYLELMRIREGESGDALDIRVELDSVVVSEVDEDDVPDETGPALEMDDEVASQTDPVSASLAIPDDPTVLSYLLSGIIQVELPRRQRLLEAATTVERLEELIALLDREVLLLSRRLRLFAPEARTMDGPRRS